MPNEHLDHGIEGFPEIKYGNRQIPSNVAKKQRCNTVGDPKLIYSGKIGNHLFAQKPIVCRAVILLFQIYLCKRNESFLTSTTPYLLPLAKNTLATRITFLLPKNPWYQFQSLGECCRRMFIHFPSINNLIVAVPPQKKWDFWRFLKAHPFGNALLQPGSTGDPRLYPSWFHSASFHEGQQRRSSLLLGVSVYDSSVYENNMHVFRVLLMKNKFSSDQNLGYIA